MEKNIYLKIKILDILYQENHIFQIEKLQKQLKTDRKTISLYIQQLNEEFPQGWEITVTKGLGAQLIKPSNQNIKDLQLLLWTESTVVRVLFKLLASEAYTVKALSHQLYTSEVTIKKVLLKLKKYASYFDLELELLPVIKFIGSEETIRVFFYWTMQLITCGQKPNTYMQQDIASMNACIEQIDKHEFSCFPNKWRVAVCAVICLERNKQKKNYSHQFLNYLQTKMIGIEDCNIYPLFLEQLPKEDIIFIDMISNSFFHNKDYFEIASKLEFTTFRNIMRDFLNQYRSEVSTKMIPDFDLLLLFTFLMRQWFFEDCFLLKNVLEEVSARDEENKEFEEHEKYVLQIFKRINKKYKITVFNEKHAKQLTKKLIPIITKKPTLKVTVVLSVGQGYRQHLIQLLGRYDDRLIVNDLYDVSEVTNENTDLLLSDLSFKVDDKIINLVISLRPNKREIEDIYSAIETLRKNK